jgi:lactaldehyde dehydrogenase/glycolaldehyde dehydrogenase
MEYYQAFIGNSFVDSSSGARMPVHDPATGEVWAEVPVCTLDDVDKAIETSRVAQLEWQMLPAQTRAEYLHAIARGLERERKLLIKLLTLEQGKPHTDADGEVTDAIRYLTYAAESARRIQGEIFPSDQPNSQLHIHRVPYGVTLALCAYNYPLALICRKVGPALVAGNTMIVKPHEATPVTASVFCRICLEAGLPSGVVNMLTGMGNDVGAKLVDSPTVRMITLTGSIRAGQMIMAAAAKNITALSLELGGSAPFIVLEDADLDAAAEAVAIARFANAGQICVSCETVMVEDSIAEAFTEKLLAKVADLKVGNPKANAGMGPITTPDALERIEKLVADSVASGAKIAFGGKRPDGAEFASGNWFEPTILVQASADTAAVTGEIFGPVLPIVSVKSYEEALRIANARPDGLSAYLWTQNPSIQMDAIKRLETGTIFINTGISGAVHGYHNGHKLSGIGGEDGIHGLEGYMQKRTVYLSY